MFIINVVKVIIEIPCYVFKKITNLVPLALATKIKFSFIPHNIDA